MFTSGDHIHKWLFNSCNNEYNILLTYAQSKITVRIQILIVQCDLDTLSKERTMISVNKNLMLMHYTILLGCLYDLSLSCL